MLVALSDIAAGDGGTLIIPASHKANLPHPQAEQYRTGTMDDMVGVVQPNLNKGDALVFCDALAHGAASRTNPNGERRTVIYRYGPSWGATRSGYRYSDELLERLPPERRAIPQPVPPRLPPPPAAPPRNAGRGSSRRAALAPAAIDIPACPASSRTMTRCGRRVPRRSWLLANQPPTALWHHDPPCGMRRQ